MKTSETTPRQIDWLVAKCEGEKVAVVYGKAVWAGSSEVEYHYSTNWAEGGPIIERELVKVSPYHNQGGWWAEHAITKSISEGSTPLIAAMRCYVASKLGEEVDVPPELI